MFGCGPECFSYTVCASLTLFVPLLHCLIDSNTVISSSSPSSTAEPDASEAEREMENHILEGLPPFKLETQVAIRAAPLLRIRHITH